MKGIKEIFKVGTRFDMYYANGERAYYYGTDVPVVEYVARMNDKSCWVGDIRWINDQKPAVSRKSWNSIETEFKMGIYRNPTN